MKRKAVQFSAIGGEGSFIYLGTKTDVETSLKNFKSKQMG